MSHLPFSHRPPPPPPLPPAPAPQVEDDQTSNAFIAMDDHIVATECELLYVRYCDSTDQDISLCFQAFTAASNAHPWKGYVEKLRQNEAEVGAAAHLVSPFKRPLMLLCGLDSNMMFWPDDLCIQLAEHAGFDAVIRVDNRCVGRSTKIDDHQQQPWLEWVLCCGRCCNGCNCCTCCKCCNSCCCCCGGATYSLQDMALDIIALCDVLFGKASSFSLAGMSKGGMISQEVALLVPSRIDTLVLVYTSSGAPSLPRPSFRCLKTLTDLPETPNLETFVEAQLAISRTNYFIPDSIWKQKGEMMEPYLRSYIKKIYDHSSYGGGRERHVAAFLTQRDRSSALRSLRCGPRTLIVHGKLDELIPPQHGLQLHQLIPGSHLLLIDEMGHSLVLSEKDTDRFVQAVREVAPGAADAAVAEAALVVTERKNKDD